MGTVDGASWSTARWLAAAEAALDDGCAQVLVATRGLVGEGWDHAPIDVLVDCSEVASSTATTQLRGRALRLHPGDPAKLASLWDVAVVHPGAPGDWLRLRRRHEHWWGPDRDGVIRTGAAKLHPRLDEAATPAIHELEDINACCAELASDHERTRRALGLGRSWWDRHHRRDRANPSRSPTGPHPGSWSDALAESLGPLGTPRWLVATDERAWRVPAVVGATRDAAERFARAIRERVPSARLHRAGTPDATAVVLRETRRRADDVDRSLRWTGRRH